MAQAVTAEPQRPASLASPTPAITFDIHSSYKQHLQGPPSLPPGLAAISALTSALQAHTTLTTVSEAISLLSELNQSLKSQLSNPLPAAAGTDAFLHYLVTTIARPGSTAGSGTATPLAPIDRQQEPPAYIDPAKTTQDVLAAAHRFIASGQKAQKQIIQLGHRLIRHDSTIILLSPNELLRDMVLNAADADVRFRVICVDLPSNSRLPGSDLVAFQTSLRDRQTPAVTIPLQDLERTIAQTLDGKTPVSSLMLLAGAEVVFANGAVLAPMRTFEAFALAAALGIEIYVVCELWKSVRVFPLPGDNLLARKRPDWQDDLYNDRRGIDNENENQMDITPPEYITSFVTERGPLPSAALGEESIRLWF